MEIHQMRYLEAVARSGSMMAAAGACHVSQPALSVQIRKLEDEIGTPLLLRGPRGVQLTSAGERTLATARKILRELEQLRTDAKRKSFTLRHTIRVAVQPYLATEWLPRLAARTLAQGERDLRIELRERAPSRLVESVASGGSDLGLVDLAIEPARTLATEEIARVSYACFCPEDHPLASRRTLRLSHLLDCAVLLYEYAPGLAARLHALASQRGVELNLPFSSEHANTVFEFVAAGAGVAVLPVSFAVRARRRQIAVLPVSDYRENTTIGVIWRREAEMPAFAHELLNSFRQQRAQGGGDAPS